MRLNEISSSRSLVNAERMVERSDDGLNYFFKATSSVSDIGSSQSEGSERIFYKNNLGQPRGPSISESRQLNNFKKKLSSNVMKVDVRNILSSGATMEIKFEEQMVRQSNIEQPELKRDSRAKDGLGRKLY